MTPPLLLLFACRAPLSPLCDEGAPFDPSDQDCDTWTSTDCDDHDHTVHPGKSETWYDGIDQDCDGASDFDADGDGLDSDLHGGSDCDDDDPSVGGDGEEIYCNGIDDDCDSDTPDADTSVQGCAFSCMTPEDGAITGSNVEFRWRSESDGGLLLVDGQGFPVGGSGSLGMTNMEAGAHKWQVWLNGYAGSQPCKLGSPVMHFTVQVE
ncbi:putative metal-binding motif-containing protein [Myxococcota bacterium]|nr:putative metal-binding motif-containing protein [Myxococcota bacterium]